MRELPCVLLKRVFPCRTCTCSRYMFPPIIIQLFYLCKSFLLKIDNTFYWIVLNKLQLYKKKQIKQNKQNKIKQNKNQIINTKTKTKRKRNKTNNNKT